jgi:hypothetical protein
MINKNNPRPPKIKGFSINFNNGKIIKKPIKPKINIKTLNKKNKREEDLFNFNFINKI